VGEGRAQEKRRTVHSGIAPDVGVPQGVGGRAGGVGVGTDTLDVVGDVGSEDEVLDVRRLLLSPPIAPRSVR
jgi:hypothetical protein